MHNLYEDRFHYTSLPPSRFHGYCDIFLNRPLWESRLFIYKTHDEKKTSLTLLPFSLWFYSVQYNSYHFHSRLDTIKYSLGSVGVFPHARNFRWGVLCAVADARKQVFQVILKCKLTFRKYTKLCLFSSIIISLFKHVSAMFLTIAQYVTD